MLTLEELRTENTTKVLNEEKTLRKTRDFMDAKAFEVSTQLKLRWVGQSRIPCRLDQFDDSQTVSPLFTLHGSVRLSSKSWSESIFETGPPVNIRRLIRSDRVAAEQGKPGKSQNLWEI